MLELKKDKELFKEMGYRLKEFRELLGLSREEMAKDLECDPGLMEHIEAGKFTRNMIFYFLYHMHMSYGLNIQWIIMGTGFPFVEVGPQIPEKFRQKYQNLCENFDKAEYKELRELMFNCPTVYDLIITKMEYIKIVARDEIKAFKEKSTKHTKNAKKRKKTDGKIVSHFL